MDEKHNPKVDETSPAHAFDKLREEVGRLRSSVETLAAERQGMPDYGPSLESVSQSLRSLIGWAKKINERPGIKMEPGTFSREFMSAADAVRRGDAEAMVKAQRELESAARRLEVTMMKDRTAADQSRILYRDRIISLVAGMLLWAIAPGVIARSLPVSWVVPERIAARMLGLDMRAAGERMVVAADVARRDQLRDPTYRAERNIGAASRESLKQSGLRPPKSLAKPQRVIRKAPTGARRHKIRCNQVDNRPLPAARDCRRRS